MLDTTIRCGAVETKLDPNSRADRLANEGAHHYMAGHPDVARMHYEGALLIEPDNAIALFNLSGLLVRNMQVAAGEVVAKRAMTLLPGNPHIKSNHAGALIRLGRYEEGLREFEEVLAVVSDNAAIWHSYSLSLYEVGRVEEAVKAIERSLELHPDDGTAEDHRTSDYGIYLIASGRVNHGTEVYEARWRTLFKSKIWNLDLPEWKGESLEGKRLLLHHEQGFGDGLMLIRFVKDLKERGAMVTFACPRELMRISEQLVKVVFWDDPIDTSNFDFHSPTLSALRWLGFESGDVSPEPYLTVPPWFRRLPEGRLKVGIMWESGDHSPIFSSRRRVVPLEMFFPLTEIPGVRLVSLQKGDAQKDIVRLGAECFIHDHMSVVEDFYDTARIINGLDLVVCADSAVTHLAGAMGKPVLTLAHFTRVQWWWNVTTALPWYKNVEVLYQAADRSWNEAMGQVYRRVTEIATKHGT